jgi:branched-chain amino acid transport system ATP-binding protein
VVREYATESGCGVLLVEQHVQLALTVADRGYVLSHGERVLHDRAEALRANRDLLMASYFGERATASLDASANRSPGPTAG